MELKTMATLQGHISSVRTLSLCKSGLPTKQINSERLLLFSGGGRAQILIWRLTIPEMSSCHENTNICDEEVSHETLCNYMMDHWNNKNRKPWKGHDLKPNPETRFMDLAVVTAKDVWSVAPPGVHVVMAACSDGYLRLYCFDEEMKNMTLLEESLFHCHCVLKIQYLIHTDSNNGCRLVCLSAATDGHIAFWDISQLVLDFIEKISYENKSGKLRSCEISCTERTADTTACNESRIKDLQMENHSSIGADISSEESCPELTNSPASVFPRDREVGFQLSRNCNYNEQEDMCDEQFNTCNHGNTFEPSNRTNKLVTDKEGLAPLFVIPSHQSGVNSLHVIQVKGKESQYLIGSGGDDNALNLSNITMTTNEKTGQLEMMFNFTVKEESAHSAQITGIHILNETQILSASVDQRLCLWNICRSETNRLQLKQEWCKFVEVADVSSMAVWEVDRLNVLVAGVGLEMLSIQ